MIDPRLEREKPLFWDSLKGIQKEKDLFLKQKRVFLANKPHQTGESLMWFQFSSSIERKEGLFFSDLGSHTQQSQSS